ncbi:MAG: tRNA uridine-5-carboxymethylaminomethyl(34) synthesis GTPase MnmE [Nitrospirota bacterium]
MYTDDTIASISTPSGRGGIGIVRLSGKDAVKIADRLFSSPKNKKLISTPSHRILYGHIINPSNGEVVDEALVSVMKAPNTYTREDIVEINCHGGMVPIKRVLELLIEGGARLAEPGEFTKRAFLNGRIDLVQSEAVLDIINSLTEQSRKAALEQLRGGLSVKIEFARNRLVDLTAIVETFIDFPDEDIEPASQKELKERAAEIQRQLKQLIENARHGRVLREGLKTAIIGRPNVGKSSLLNALLEQDRVIVTEMPGTTRDVIEEYLDINGFPVRIMDTAGIRESADIAESEGVARSLRAMKDADIVLLVLDGSTSLHDTDIELIERSGSGNSILVINKSDLPSEITQDALPNDRPAVKISALKGTGLDELKNEIVRTSLKEAAGTGVAIATNVRHIKAIERAYHSINSFTKNLKKGLSPEFLAVDLRDGLDALGEIIGITTPEEILNKIFSDFCIGK